jgi:hypothetical protein
MLVPRTAASVADYSPRGDPDHLIGAARYEGGSSRHIGFRIVTGREGFPS